LYLQIDKENYTAWNTTENSGKPRSTCSSIFSKIYYPNKKHICVFV